MAFEVPIFASPIAKKGESVRIVVGYPYAVGVAVEIYILDSSGRQLTVPITIQASIGGRTALSSWSFNYVFPSHGTFTVFAYVEVAPVPDIYTGACVVHVPAWLENIDRPISDITKANTEMSRLRTTITRNAGK
ncbi:MAG: hypothetical protein KKB51_23685 [Candidatus Riflebacteria bacterium]|nr:hypothetical protein [Candidatus Riflebacteria bacterium]